jgi:hypothetical protein
VTEMQDEGKETAEIASSGVDISAKKNKTA